MHSNHFAAFLTVVASLLMLNVALPLKDRASPTDEISNEVFRGSYYPPGDRRSNLSYKERRSPEDEVSDEVFDIAY